MAKECPVGGECLVPGHVVEIENLKAWCQQLTDNDTSMTTLANNHNSEVQRSLGNIEGKLDGLARRANSRTNGNGDNGILRHPLVIGLITLLVGALIAIATIVMTLVVSD